MWRVIVDGEVVLSSEVACFAKEHYYKVLHTKVPFLVGYQHIRLVKETATQTDLIWSAWVCRCGAISADIWRSL